MAYTSTKEVWVDKVYLVWWDEDENELVSIHTSMESAQKKIKSECEYNEDMEEDEFWVDEYMVED